MDDFAPATRITGNNARGNKRRIGNSKRSSLDSSEVAEHGNRKQRTSDTAIAVASAPADSCLPTLPGVGSFLHNQRLGSKGIKTKIKNATYEAENLQISMEDYKIFCEYTRHCDPNEMHYKVIESQREGQSANKIWLLLSDFNVLLYGLGCKRRVIGGLVNSYLQGEDVIELDGEDSASAFSNDRCIKVLLNHITKDVLKHKGSIDSCSVSLQNQTRILTDLLNIHYGRGSLVKGGAVSASFLTADREGGSASKFIADADDAVGRKRSSRAVVADADRWGGRYALAQSKLYIVVNDICGPALCSETTQQCLAILAECKSVALIATVENLNSVVHWDRRVLAAFCWSYHHVPTYEPLSTLTESFPLISRDLDAIEASATKKRAEGMLEGDSDGDEVMAGSSTAWLSNAELGTSPGQPSSLKPAALDQVNPLPLHNGIDRPEPSAAASSSSVVRDGVNPKRKHSSSVSASIAGRSLAALTDSVTANHNDLIKLLVNTIKDKRRRLQTQRDAEADAQTEAGKRAARTRGAAGSSHSAAAVAAGRISHETGIQIDTLLQLAKASVTVKDMKGLRNLLKEFMDHSVVTIISHQGKEYVCLKPPFDSYLQDNFVEKLASVIGRS